MDQNLNLKLKQELIWWAVIGLLCLFILIPLWTHKVEFPFLTYNLIYIVVFVTFTRLIFLLKHTFIASAFVIKLILIFLSIPIIILLIDGLSMFQAFLDEIGIQSIMGHLSFKQQNNLSQFIKSEFIFFGVSAVITAIILPMRMVVSIWRVRNRGTV